MRADAWREDRQASTESHSGTTWPVLPDLVVLILGIIEAQNPSSLGWSSARGTEKEENERAMGNNLDSSPITFVSWPSAPSGDPIILRQSFSSPIFSTSRYTVLEKSHRIFGHERCVTVVCRDDRSQEVEVRHRDDEIGWGCGKHIVFTLLPISFAWKNIFRSTVSCNFICFLNSSYFNNSPMTTAAVNESIVTKFCFQVFWLLHNKHMRLV